MNTNYKCIGQPANVNEAMFCVLESLVGTKKAREKFRKDNGCTYFPENRLWADTNIVHDTILAYNMAVAARKIQPCGHL